MEAFLEMDHSLPLAMYPIPILNLGFVGFKRELNSNQVTVSIDHKFRHLPKLHSRLDP
jgi:hypothetical protein